MPRRGLFSSSNLSRRKSKSVNKLTNPVSPAAYINNIQRREIPITRRFLDGTDLCDETDLRRFDQISLGSSTVFCAPRVIEFAVDGRDTPVPREAAFIVSPSPNAISKTL